MLKSTLLSALIAIAYGSLTLGPVTIADAQTPPIARNSGFSEQELRNFAALEPIDTHTHIYKNDPEFFAMLQKLHLHTLDIVDVSDNTSPERKDWAKENNDVFGVSNDSDAHVSVCTTFDPYRISQPDFETVALQQINESFARGAIAVKVWKNIGMEVKDAKGNYILPDNPLLEPIYKDILAHNKTLITHVADPDTAWLPPDPTKSDSTYYVNNPEWYMYRIPGSPSKESILLARDHVLEMNPHLRVIGAHLGSMESNLNEVSAHLDRYPNFAVDLAGRMRYLMAVPRPQMIAFITKYQDRILYGTDNSIYPETDVAKWVVRTEASYAADWRFLATGDMVNDRGHKVEGLDLPESILRKIYHDNAVHWLPGIASK